MREWVKEGAEPGFCFFHANFPIVFLKQPVFLSVTVSAEQRFRVRKGFLLQF